MNRVNRVGIVVLSILMATMFGLLILSLSIKSSPKAVNSLMDDLGKSMDRQKGQLENINSELELRIEESNKFYEQLRRDSLPEPKSITITPSCIAISDDVTSVDLRNAITMLQRMDIP